MKAVKSSVNEKLCLLEQGLKYLLSSSLRHACKRLRKQKVNEKGKFILLLREEETLINIIFCYFEILNLMDPSLKISSG